MPSPRKAGAAPTAADHILHLPLRDGGVVPVRLKINPRARRVSVRIDATRREAIATAPGPRALASAQRFAAERADWIAGELARLPHSIPLQPGARIPLRGAMVELWPEPGRGGARIEGERLVVPSPDEDLFAARVKRFLVAEARRDLEARVALYAQRLGVRAARIAIKEIRSRWGSCTSDGALAFSWRVILAPPFVLDYLAA
ncbi:MAG: YgjP-like metallopeptidase domain-containing protein, partial [Hyphomonadaceae bacterium]|nr:YgjP-like metallopeptidase domain-containing protein [Hyphomonadaceae bacterium]